MFNQNQLSLLAIENDFQPFDVISFVFTSNPLIRHYLIFERINDYGEVIAYANFQALKCDPRTGPREVSTKVFNYFLSLGIQDIIHHPFQGDEIEAQKAFYRLQSSINNPAEYKLTSWNCEHFANYVQTGVAQSYQVQKGALAAAALAAFGCTSDNSTVKTASWIGLLFAGGLAIREMFRA